MLPSSLGNSQCTCQSLRRELGRGVLAESDTETIEGILAPMDVDT